jgi:hypothetical protein
MSLKRVTESAVWAVTLRCVAPESETLGHHLGLGFQEHQVRFFGHWNISPLAHGLINPVFRVWHQIEHVIRSSFGILGPTWNGWLWFEVLIPRVKLLIPQFLVPAHSDSRSGTFRFFRELRLMTECVVGSMMNAVWCRGTQTRNTPPPVHQTTHVSFLLRITVFGWRQPTWLPTLEFSISDVVERHPIASIFNLPFWWASKWLDSIIFNPTGEFWI